MLATNTIFLFFALPLLRLASAVVTINAGKVFTPVRFGHIHVFISPSDFLPCFNDTAALLATLRSRPLSPQGRQELARMEHRDRQEIEKALQLHQQLLYATFPVPTNGTAVQGPQRDKRSAILIAAGVAAIVGGTIAALGLGTANRVELDKLTDVVEKIDDDFISLITTLEGNSVDVSDNFKSLNTSIHQLAVELERTEERLLFAQAWNELMLFHTQLQRRLNDWLSAVYAAYSGQLHPALVPVPRLTAGLAKLEAFAGAQGFRLAPLENLFQSFFTANVAMKTNSSGMHLFVPIPLIPQGMDELVLLQPAHHPVRISDTLELNFDMEEKLLITDPLHTFHREITQAQLSGCRRWEDTYFCTFRQFFKRPATCLGSVLLRDATGIASLCQKFITKAGTTPSLREEGHVTILWSREETVVRKECPAHPEDQSVWRVEGSLTVNTTAGCSLSTEEWIFFPAHEANLTVGVHQPLEYDLGLLLEGLTIEQVQDAVHHLHQDQPLREVRLDLSRIRAHQEGVRSQLHRDSHLTLTYSTLAIAGLGAFFAGGLALALGARIAFLRRKK